MKSESGERHRRIVRVCDVGAGTARTEARRSLKVCGALSDSWLTDSDGMHMDRQQRSLAHTHSRSATLAAAAVSRLVPPFRFRWRREPADLVDGHATLDVCPAPLDDSLAAYLASTHPLDTVVVVDARRTFAGRAEHVSRSMRSLFERQGLSRSLIVDQSTLRALSQRTLRRLTVARVNGPVDVADARALELALRAGTPPLEAELRATAVAQFTPAHGSSTATWAQFRDDRAARHFLGQLTARWLGRVLGDPAVPPPPDAIVRGALATGGTIRAHDLHDSSATLDIAIRTARGRVSGRIALDRLTGAWYG